MGGGTLLRYLIGDRQAILTIAASRPALWVGLLFVLSAGFAREYDGEDLTREPWHLLIPVGASLLTSWVLFMMTFGAVQDPASPSIYTAYPSFLTLYWMTAPLAWLYAVPYERLLSPADAVAANLWTLALVSVWRVALMVRVVSVLMGYRVVHAFFLVMTFADAIAFLAAWLVPRPVFAIMGGVRLTDAERLILAMTHNLMIFGGCSFPVWLCGAIAAWSNEKPAWQVPARPAGPTAPRKGLWALAVASVALWVLVLPWTQAEQRLRSTVEQDLRSGRIAEAFATMSDRGPDAFPPHWDPPPRVGYGEAVPPLIDVLELMVQQPPAAWVQEVYAEKLSNHLGHQYGFLQIGGKEAGRILKLLPHLPNGPELTEVHGRRLEEVAKQDVEERRDSPETDPPAAAKKDSGPPDTDGAKP